MKWKVAVGRVYMTWQPPAPSGAGEDVEVLRYVARLAPVQTLDAAAAAAATAAAATAAAAVDWNAVNGGVGAAVPRTAMVRGEQINGQNLA